MGEGGVGGVAAVQLQEVVGFADQAVAGAVS